MSIATIVFGIAMLVAAASDLARRRIPNWMNLSILLAGLAVQAASGGLGGVGRGLAGAALGMALLLPLFKMRWIGGGDVKLVAAIGAWLGPTYVFWSTLIGLAGGGALSLIVALAGGEALRSDVRTNLVNAALARSAPEAPRRARSQLVPMAVALGGAAVGVFLAAGSLS